MQKRLKVLIVYASAGAGHFKAAEAAYSYFKEKCKDIDAEIIDVLNEANPLFRFNYSWGYTHLITSAPLLWQLAFWVTYNKPLRFITRPVASIINRLNTKDFAGILIQKNPDYIISTHFLPSEIAALLKKEKKINSKLITVITDFQVHPFWVEPETDVYIVASGFTKKLLISEGISEDKIRESGIPIHSKFLEEQNKEILCEKLGIANNKFTVLIVTGSFGMGPIQEIIGMLYKDTQILVVCAKNKELYERLKEKNYPDVLVFGFIDNMQELMAVSDVIVTKPGGLSISELLSLELAPVFISPIPGQETSNIEALKSYGVGISAKDANELQKIVLDYKEHPEKLTSIKENIKKIKKPNATQELCNVVRQGCNGIGS